MNKKLKFERMHYLDNRGGITTKSKCTHKSIIVEVDGQEVGELVNWRNKVGDVYGDKAVGPEGKKYWSGWMYKHFDSMKCHCFGLDGKVERPNDRYTPLLQDVNAAKRALIHHFDYIQRWG